MWHAAVEEQGVRFFLHICDDGTPQAGYTQDAVILKDNSVIFSAALAALYILLGVFLFTELLVPPLNFD